MTGYGPRPGREREEGGGGGGGGLARLTVSEAKTGDSVAYIYNTITLECIHLGVLTFPHKPSHRCRRTKKKKKKPYTLKHSSKHA